MKKLMIAAAAAAMIGGANAACSENAGCVVWDLKFSLKSLAPKALTCKDACGDKTTVYYLDQTTRSLKGYLWACDYECGDDLNIVLWDTKNKRSIIAMPHGSDYQTIPSGFDNINLYGKKANKAFANFEFTGDDADSVTAIDLQAAGIGGTVGKLGEPCGCYAYVKSLSGYAAGTILIDAPTTVTYDKYCYETPVKWDVCGNPVAWKKVCAKVVDDVSEEDILTLPLCNYCDFTNWCESEDAETADLMVPAVGTWSMKYNKSISTGTKYISQYVPDYAF